MRGQVHGTVVVAIDGPAGSGKSTLSRALADRLGLRRLDTGAMYRSVAWAVLQWGIDTEDGEAVADLARILTIEVGDRVVVDGTDGPTWVLASTVDVPQGESRDVTVRFHIPGRHYSMTVEPSARVPPMRWQVDSQVFDDAKQTTLSW